MISRSALTLAIASAISAGCMGGSGGDEGSGGGGGGGDGDDVGSGSGSGSGSTGDSWEDKLNNRQYNYPAALRTASLRLLGELPSVTQVEQIATAGDAKTAYEAAITAMLADARFQRQALGFWRDTFRMGGAADLDAAPAFATQLTVSNGSSDQLFIATTGTCPTVAANGTITAANCANNPPQTAGVLTNPGVMKHFNSNMAFRRVRWVQETFDCTAFPAEVQAPQPAGPNNAPYTAPWPFTSIAGAGNGGRVDFHDTSAVVCANCHATMNHLAPLFANFDANGLYTAQIAVVLPTDGMPRAVLGDFLPAGEPTAWRMGKPAANLAALGQAMVADPKVAACTVARVWNFALGKGDIVTTLSVVPPDVIADQVAAFDANGRKLRDLFFRVFTSDDFTKY